MNHILLINPGHDQSHAISDNRDIRAGRKIHRDPPPMSILVVGTHYRKLGYRVDILDTHIEEKWAQKLHELIKNNKYDWIGITIIIGRFLKNGVEITKHIQSIDKTIPIIWGGVMCSVMPEEIHSHYPDITLHTGSIGKLDAIDWGLLGNNCNREQKPYYQMLFTSYGCPFNCAFCYNLSGGEKRKIEYRTTENICAEMDWLYSERGINVFTMGDDNFLLKESRAIQILEHCKSHGYYIEECTGHINNLSDSLIEAMKGVVQTFIFSVETVSENLQIMLNKRIRLDEVSEKLNRLKQAGIVCNISFMIGLPDEDDSDLLLNWRYMENWRKIHPYIRGNCYLWYPLPKTQLTEYAEKRYNRSFHFTLEDYENADFWVHDKNDMSSLKYRPHLTKKRYEYLLDWGAQFNDTFRRPQDRTFYVLDKVLRGDKS